MAIANFEIGNKEFEVRFISESGWVEIGDKHYCPNCCKFNDILSPYI